MSTIFLYKHYLFTRLKHSFGLIFPGAWWCNKCFKVLFYGWLWCNQVGFSLPKDIYLSPAYLCFISFVFLSFSSPYRRCPFITRMLVLLFFPIFIISFSYFFCSNVLAGHLFGIPLRGTHSHAYVSSYMVSKISFMLPVTNEQKLSICSSFCYHQNAFLCLSIL
jgi:hypothetical protein